ncbi:MAG: S8 family serine peptidase [Clostridiales bacterium]|nr:S8 family serine peptidase [Clostridiales bacterium]
MKRVKKVVAILIAVMMVMAYLPLTGLAFSGADGGRPGFGAIDPSSLHVRKIGEADAEKDIPAEPVYDYDDIVRVSIFLDDKAAIGAGFSVKTAGTDRKAAIYRAKLKVAQEEVTKDIEKKLGHRLEVKWNLTLLVNAISAEIKYGEIGNISSVAGVKTVQIENTYLPQTVDINTAGTSQYMVGAAEVWNAGYTGAGTKIAVIDTGIDAGHQSFNEDAFEYALSLLDNAPDLLDEDDIDAVSEYLHAGSYTFISSKIPFAYNYADDNTTVDHMHDRQGEHGSHVSGIAAGNRYVKDPSDPNAFIDSADEFFAVGMAPDAQIVVMKVFGSHGLASDADYMAAIEDAMTLGCESCNLSLGSTSQGFTYDTIYQDVLNSLSDPDVNDGMVVSISVGNSGTMADNSLTNQPYIFAEDISFHTGGAPGTYINSLGTASADNISATDNRFLNIAGENLFYFEDPDTVREKLVTLAGARDFVYVDSIGTEEDYLAVNGAVSLAGKIVIVNRGGNYFSEKCNNAAPYSPAAVIIANNTAGSFYVNPMDITGSFPAVSIQLDSANHIKDSFPPMSSGEVTYYTGTLTVIDQPIFGVTGSRTDAQPSSFSSWGVPGSLIMKPEITAPGGNIWSVAGTHLTKEGNVAGGVDQYENMSGTSMAAPHIAGLAAVLTQYVRENGIEIPGYSTRAIVQSLLMSTAEPMVNEQIDEYESILAQGAGLVDLASATSSSSVVFVTDLVPNLTTGTGAAADGKVKIELGEFPDRNSEYTFSFRIYNISDRMLEFDDPFTDVFTQEIKTSNSVDYLTGMTIAAGSQVEYSWEAHSGISYDVNKDGVTDQDDAQAVLDLITGNINADTSAVDGSALDLDAADADGDGSVTTYDAYLILHYEPENIPEGCFVPAGGYADVVIVFEFDVDASVYQVGAYIEGFTFISEKASTEGAAGVTHSIPILGFWGNWTDASMFDNTSYTDVLYNTDYFPYSGNDDTNYLTLTYNGITSRFTGNPYTVESEFPYDRLAVNSSSEFKSIYYTLLRSAGTTGVAFSLLDGNGSIDDVLSVSGIGYQTEGLWFDPDENEWQNTLPRSCQVGIAAGDLGLEEEDFFRIGLYALPEYYGMLFASDLTGGSAGLLDTFGFAGAIYYEVPGTGAYIGYDFTVDDTAPVIQAADLSGHNLTVTASDNLNIAYIAVMTLDGDTVYCDTAPGAPDFEGTFDISEAVSGANGYVAVFVGDYAGNEAAVAVRVNDDIYERKTVFAQTNTLVDGRDYLLLNRLENSDGDAKALDYYFVAGEPLPTELIVPVHKGITATSSRPFIYRNDINQTCIWTANVRNNQAVFQNGEYYLGIDSGNDLAIISEEGQWVWNEQSALAIRAHGGGMRYLTCSAGYYGLTTQQDAHVYFYEKKTITTEFEIDPFSVKSVELNEDSIDIYKGNEVELIATVNPLTASDKRLIWSSDDTSVAAVDANGKITAVGEGACVISAESVSNPGVRANCLVVVTVVDTDLNAVIWDEAANRCFAAFNTASLPEWTPLDVNDDGLAVYSAFIDDDLDLYVATLEYSDMTSELYYVDPDDYSLTRVAEFAVGVTDIAPGAAGSSDKQRVGLVYTYGPYLIAGSGVPMDDGSGNAVIGLPETIYNHSTGHDGVYLSAVACKLRYEGGGMYYLLDENGTVWETELFYDDVGDEYFFSDPVALIETGVEADFVEQSIYYDGNYIYWGHTGDANCAELYLIDPVYGKVFNAGSFGDNVWPVTGIYTDGNTVPTEHVGTSAAPAPGAGSRGTGTISPEKVVSRIRQSSGLMKSGAADTRVNRVDAVTKPAASPVVRSAFGTCVRSSALRPSRPGRAAVMSADPATVGEVVLTASSETTNGFFYLTYDPDELVFAGLGDSDPALLYSMNTGTPGLIRFAFALETPAETGSAVYTFLFEKACTDQTVICDMMELNAAFDVGLSEDYTVEGHGHNYVPEVVNEASYGHEGLVRYTCDYCGDSYEEAIPPKQAASYSASLTLEDSIDINFFVKEIDEEADITEFLVEYTFRGVTSTATLSNYDSNRIVVARCSVKEIGDDVNIKVYYGSDLIKEIDYSARRYCENKISGDSVSANLKEFCKAALDYGAYAQLYFDYHTDNLANSTYSAGTVTETVIPGSVNVHTSTGSCSGVTQMSASLMLESKTELNFYFVPAEGVNLQDLTICLNGNEVSSDSITVAPSGAYCLTVREITAGHLGDEQEISISYQGETKTVVYSPLTWAYKKQTSNKEATANLAKALYCYYLAAVGYLQQ